MFKVLSVVALSIISGLAFAEQSNTSFDGHRVGVGFSKSKDVTSGETLDMGSGVKLEYGYEINRIFGINASYQGFSDSDIFIEIDGYAAKLDTDIGYTFELDQFNIKPYVALGWAYVKEEWDYSFGKETFSDSAFLFGFGARATLMENFYADLRFDYLTADYADIDQFSMTLGYKF